MSLHRLLFLAVIALVATLMCAATVILGPVLAAYVEGHTPPRFVPPYVSQQSTIATVELPPPEPLLKLPGWASGFSFSEFFYDSPYTISFDDYGVFAPRDWTYYAIGFRRSRAQVPMTEEHAQHHFTNDILYLLIEESGWPIRYAARVQPANFISIGQLERSVLYFPQSWKQGICIQDHLNFLPKSKRQSREHIIVIPTQFSTGRLAINWLIWFAAVTIVLVVPFRLRRVIRKRKGRCVLCKYDMRGLDRCPECGAVPTSAAKLILFPRPRRPSADA
ncbi:MAG: hypothetical protein H6815_04385 [Phycisphaeraceae bacterium]|nr:hypothetical protein [Phycisphaerales bacterium]MCB9859670.1 hypothetical protein [Phycisphaeraceae bacterium]